MDVCNMDEARKAMDNAEKKVSENDYVEAKKIVKKAQSLYPKLDGLKQVLMMIDVYIAASDGGEDADWYGVLLVDPWANNETLKKQYKRLALLLHPDKNNFNGAEGAFKLVLEAWCLLSDKVKRDSYDQIRESRRRNKELHKEAKVKMQKQRSQKRARGKRNKPNNKHSAHSSRQRKGDFIYDFMF